MKGAHRVLSMRGSANTDGGYQGLLKGRVYYFGFKGIRAVIVYGEVEALFRVEAGNRIRRPLEWGYGGDRYALPESRQGWLL